MSNDPNEGKKRRVGNVNIDYDPDEEKHTRKGRTKGGEYIDYEEVKE